MYRHTYIYTLFVDRFAVVVFIAFSAICMGRVSVSLRFFLFFGLTCVRISCDSFLNYCFVFSSFFLLFLLLFQSAQIYIYSVVSKLYKCAAIALQHDEVLTFSNY